jgi:hypothetical protein
LQSTGDVNRPNVLPAPIGGVWQMFVDAGGTYFVNDNPLADTWQTGIEGFAPMFPGVFGEVDHAAAECNGNFVMTFTTNGPGQAYCYVEVFNSVGQDAPAVINPDNIPGGITKRGLLY